MKTISCTLFKPAQKDSFDRSLAYLYILYDDEKTSLNFVHRWKINKELFESMELEIIKSYGRI
jgi:hypothetical protein